MIKMMASICRRPGMTHAEYLSYIQHVHGAISNESPDKLLRRYVQNHVFDAAFGTAAEATHSQVVSRDSVTELYWDSPQEMGASFQHEYTRTKIGPDGVNFSDLPVALSLVAVEAEQPVPQPGRHTGAKVLHFVRAAEGLALPEFFERRMKLQWAITCNASRTSSTASLTARSVSTCSPRRCRCVARSTDRKRFSMACLSAAQCPPGRFELRFARRAALTPRT